MQKTKLNKFIQKYNLGGNVNSVKWKSSGDSISTSFVTPDKSLLGNVTVDKFPFDEAEIGVYQTDQLKSLINVLGDDVSLDLTRFGDKAVSLKVKNGPVSVDYVLSDLSVISDPPQMKRLPEFGTKIKLDRSFIDTFIKGKGALSGVDTFTVVKTDEGCDVDTPITFNANLFKEVLVANRECSSAILEVSTKGLAKVNFKIDDYDSTYFIVAMQDVD